MSPKRRYQSSSVGIGLPPPPLPPPEYFANLTYSYNRPITSSEIAVNPCLTSKKIPTVGTTGAGGGGVTSTPTKKGSKPGGGDDYPHHPQQQPIKQTPQKTTASSSKGNRTYRVRHHHQNHYEPPVTYHHQGSNTNTTSNTGGDQSRPTSSSLSQGIFGLPVMQDYFQYRSEETHEETLADQHPPQPKPRMKSTLPSFKNSLPPPSSDLSHHHHLHPNPSQEDMDGVIKVRPASRQSRTRPEHGGAGGTMRRSTGGPAGGGGPRRRVQSTASFHPHSMKPSTPIETFTDSSHPIAPELIDSIIFKLKSQDSDWEEIVDGFHSIQRLTSDSPSNINKANLRKIIMSGLPHLSSSRTKLSRAACQCFKILYETQCRSMEGEGDKVFQRLLDLCGGPHNKFIQEECKVALLAAVNNTDPLKCVHLLEIYGSRHKNPNVREFAALLLSKTMEVVGSMDKLLSKEFAQRILPMIVSFLREGQLNTRLNGKQCLGKVFSHPEFQTKLRRFVPPENIRHVQDTLKKFQQQQQNQHKRSSTAAMR